MDGRKFLRGVAISAVIIPTLAFAEPRIAPLNRILDSYSAISKETLQDKTLQDKIDLAVSNLTLEGYITSEERVAVVAQDLTTREVLVSRNAYEEMQAASTVKPPIEFVVRHKVNAGKLALDEVLERAMEVCIRESNNAASNYLMFRAGGPEEVQRVLSELFRPGYGINIKEYFPFTRSSKTLTDEFKTKYGVEIPFAANGKALYANTSTPDFNLRFLERMWKERKVPVWSQIFSSMSRFNKNINYVPVRLGHSSSEIPARTDINSSTGSHAKDVQEMGIIQGKGKDGKIYPYSLVVNIDRPTRAENEREFYNRGRNAIAIISRIVYHHMKEKYNLI